MPIYLDMMHFPVEVDARPQRIVSLVPSLSLLLHDIGVDKRLVGVTKFCVKPIEMKQEKTIIGGTKLLHIDKILDLKPDLVIANKEENNEVDIGRLRADVPVWVSDIQSFDDALEAMNQLGQIVDCAEETKLLQAEIMAERATYQNGAPANSGRVAYVIWNDPIMVAGDDTFIHSMLTEGGWTNALDGHKRYPAITLDGLKALRPDYIFLSSEPFPFKEKHISKFETVVKKENIILVDGELFSWYGSRLKDSYTYFSSLQESIKTTTK